MSKPANKTMIGAFVLGAVALTVAAIILFGSGRFFKDTDTWVAFFPGSVAGLSVGSPVVFRGVQVGQVTEIIVNFDPSDISVNIPVIFETDPDRFRTIGPKVIADDEEFHQALVAQGLRAQLQLQSLVTGQLAVNMDFFPDRPGTTFGVANAEIGNRVPEWAELPTIPTPLQQIEQALNELNFKDLVEDIRGAAAGIAKLATDPKLQDSIGEVSETLRAVKKLAQNLDTKVEPLATSLDQTLVDVRAGIGDARQLMATDVKDTIKSMKTALDNANKTLASVENLAEEGTQLRHEISFTLREVGAAARAARVLAEFIEQHPDAIIRGRATGTGGD